MKGSKLKLYRFTKHTHKHSYQCSNRAKMMMMAHYKAILFSSFNRNAFNLISWKAGKFWFEKHRIYIEIY